MDVISEIEENNTESRHKGERKRQEIQKTLNDAIQYLQEKREIERARRVHMNMARHTTRMCYVKRSMV